MEVSAAEYNSAASAANPEAPLLSSTELERIVKNQHVSGEAWLVADFELAARAQKSARERRREELGVLGLSVQDAFAAVADSVLGLIGDLLSAPPEGRSLPNHFFVSVTKDARLVNLGLALIFFTSIVLMIGFTAKM